MVRARLSSDPVLDEAIGQGVVNLSALARRLRAEFARQGVRGVSEDAVKASLVRYRRDAGKTRADLESPVKRIIALGQIQLRDDIASLVLQPFAEAFQVLSRHVDRVSAADTFHVVRGIGGILVVVDERRLGGLLSAFPKSLVKGVQRDLAAVIIRSPEEVAETPGVVYYYFRSLFLARVNIVQELSCYTDTIILVSRGDALRAYEAVKEVIEECRREVG